MRKKISILSGLLIYLAVGVYAETSISLGLGGEINQYSEESLAVGFAAIIDYRFSELFSLGERTVYSSDMDSSRPTLEFAGTVRFYFLRFKRLLDYYYVWQNKLHWFFQFDVGGAFAYAGDSAHLSFSDWMFGGIAGLRYVFGDKEKFFIEPYIRFSSTSNFGAGALLGMSFYANPR
jgi:hypothetical protein